MANSKPFETIPRQPEQLAYVAGLFDGEGCICIFPTNYRPKTGANYGASRYGIIVNIQMCNEVVIRWLCNEFGGSFVHSRKNRKNPRLKDSFQFKLKEDRAIGLLKLLYPYLRVKKEEAALLFKFIEVKKQSRYRADSHRALLMDELYWKMKSFKRKTLSASERLRIHRQNQDAVETERPAPSFGGMKFQPELAGDCENAEPVMTPAV
jgi:hypothetical protein